MIFAILLLGLLTDCHCLLSPHDSNHSMDDLYSMIQQMNKTIKHLETVNAQQDNLIAKLGGKLNFTTIGFYARLPHGMANLGDNQAIEFDQVITNVGHGYDPRHGHFIAPITGLYLISSSVMSVGGHDLYCEILKNGQMVSRLYGGTADAEGNTQTFVIELQLGDMVWVRHSAGDTTEAINAYNAYFSGFLISPQ